MEHFNNLLNRPSTVDSSALDQITQNPTIDSLDPPPTLDEVRKAISQTSSGEAPGMKGVPSELFNAAGPVAQLSQPFNEHMGGCRCAQGFQGCDDCFSNRRECT